MNDPVHAAWLKANAAWMTAGGAVPCYDPAYLAAREELARVMERVDAARLETPVRKLPDWRNPVDEK